MEAEIGGIIAGIAAIVGAIGAFWKTASERGVQVAGVYGELVGDLQGEIKRRESVEKELRRENLTLHGEISELRAVNAEQGATIDRQGDEISGLKHVVAELRQRLDRIERGTDG